ncbi:MAG TPA: isoprenyl transferase [Nitrospiria bacterium]|nr:isoprenyl transferase [Nitrospiria bacterium]
MERKLVIEPDESAGGTAGPSDEALLARVTRGELPRHVAIIMDGNGRWAELQRLPRIAGHRAGIESAREIVECCRELGVQVLTMFAFSSENWQRPLTEVRELMHLLEQYLKRELPTLKKHEIRFRAIGRTGVLPGSVRRWIGRVESETAHYTCMTLNLALNYGGRAEIVDAVTALCADLQAGRLGSAQVTEAVLARYLTTGALPDPDLIIRTSGEYRISNFLLWQAAYAELYFTKTLWPDFHRRELLLALIDYQRRERRFGRVQQRTGGTWF